MERIHAKNLPGTGKLITKQKKKHFSRLSMIWKIEKTFLVRFIPPSSGTIGNRCGKSIRILASRNIRLGHLGQEMKHLTWGCQPSSSAQRNVASFSASLSIANFVVPLFTPRWSWTDSTGLLYQQHISPSIPSVCWGGGRKIWRHRSRQKQTYN